MTQTYKPEGYSSVSAYLLVDGASRIIDFLQQVFGAELLRRIENPDGTLMHAEVRIDDTIVMLADRPDDYPEAPGMIHVYVPDVDAVHTRALEAGGVSVQAPEQKADPDRRGGFKDPAGNTWWIATQVG